MLQVHVGFPREGSSPFLGTINPCKLLTCKDLLFSLIHASPQKLSRSPYLPMSICSKACATDKLTGFGRPHSGFVNGACWSAPYVLESAKNNQSVIKQKIAFAHASDNLFLTTESLADRSAISHTQTLWLCPRSISQMYPIRSPFRHRGWQRPSLEAKS